MISGVSSEQTMNQHKKMGDIVVCAKEIADPEIRAAHARIYHIEFADIHYLCNFAIY